MIHERLLAAVSEAFHIFVPPFHEEPAAEEDRTPSASGSGSSLPQDSSAKDSSGTSKPAARGWGNIKLRM